MYGVDVPPGTVLWLEWIQQTLQFRQMSAVFILIHTLIKVHEVITKFMLVP